MHPFALNEEEIEQVAGAGSATTPAPAPAMMITWGIGEDGHTSLWTENGGPWNQMQ